LRDQSIIRSDNITAYNYVEKTSIEKRKPNPKEKQTRPKENGRVVQTKQ
jgi:hypothetical protein